MVLWVLVLKLLLAVPIFLLTELLELLDELDNVEKGAQPYLT